ncbi:isoleucine--tRNA ligase [Vulcanococcus limneticus]|uniref:isoleucine--tRNA ligase n=1 Tax=Vulcanococcus limneticus TaxID=2170428 RepID=UPI00398C1D05
MRANARVREPEIQAFWAERRLYERLSREGLSPDRPGPVFTLHDGPPYANGALHVGHALNKVLKDIINKHALLNGKRARFVPGWDCHGLPIELKVLQGLSSDERQQLTPLGLRRRAHAYALEQVEGQRSGFRRWGIWADWDQPYLTLNKSYEAAQIGVFGQMVLAGHIYRGLKPVHWSPSSRTALAEAELEYPDGHTSPSAYVAFPVVELPAALAGELRPHGIEGPTDQHHREQLFVAIWTTTPWTLPANLAVAVNGELDYAICRDCSAPADAPRYLVVAEALVDSLRTTLERPLEPLLSVKGQALEGILYRHPLLDRTAPVLMGGDYVTTESGTGLVHTAPGHGVDDFNTGRKHGLAVLCPVDEGGTLTAEAGPFAGLNVLKDANAAILAALRDTGTLLAEQSYAHRYPYDWRTKKPTIFRATEQWFASVEGFRDEALAAIAAVTWMPESGRNRIEAMVRDRGDWCISRQRTWGVPIPVFYHRDSGEVLLNADTLAHIQALIAEHGSDVWWERNEAGLLPPAWADQADQWRKGTDTMDVWFDSGSSWAGVLGGLKAATESGGTSAGPAAGDGALGAGAAAAGADGEAAVAASAAAASVGGPAGAVSAGDTPLNFPADLYLEGSDQHRGWFQSSLLTAVAVTGGAPYQRVLTHGFVLDEKGRKMSKSLGNVVDPAVLVEGGKNEKQEPAYGADVLRLWVSSVDYSADVPLGPGIVKQLADVYRKVRNTARYLLGNLHDFDPRPQAEGGDAVPIAELPLLDRWMLQRTAALIDVVSADFERYEFYRFFQALQNYCVVDLSNVYLDIAKDRLYVSAAASFRRRSCQTVLHLVVERLAGLIAPVLCHMAEDIWQNLPYPVAEASVFERGWPTVPAEWRAGADGGYGAETDAAVQELLFTLRPRVNRLLEACRRQQVGFTHPQGSAEAIGSSLEAQVQLALDGTGGSLAEALALLEASPHPEVDNLVDWLLVSALRFGGEPPAAVLAEASDEGITVRIARAAGEKCERCWHYETDIGQHPAHPTVCGRCVAVLEG